MTIGERLKHYRLSKKVSQQSIELLLDLLPGEISRIENGKSLPDPHNLLKLMHTLSVSESEISILFKTEDNPLS